MRFGRIFFWWIILFLVSFVFVQLSFTVTLMTGMGTTKESVLVFLNVIGLIIIVVLDFTFGDD